MPRNRRAMDQASATYLESLANALGEDRNATLSERIDVEFIDEAGQVTRYVYESTSGETPNDLEEANAQALAAREEFETAAEGGTTKRSGK